MTSAGASTTLTGRSSGGTLGGASAGETAAAEKAAPKLKKRNKKRQGTPVSLLCHTFNHTSGWVDESEIVHHFCKLPLLA